MITTVEVAMAAACIATKGRRVSEDGGGLGHELTAAVKSVAAETDRLVFKALVVHETHIFTADFFVFAVGDNEFLADYVLSKYICTQFLKCYKDTYICKDSNPALWERIIIYLFLLHIFC